MKKLLLTLLLSSAIICFGQNTAPIAVNDTFYVNHNDSVSYMAPSLPVYINDSDPDGDNIFIDTAYYYGTGYFSFNTVLTTPTTAFVRFNYKPSLDFWGLDSVQYILRDDGAPIKYDTAWIYLRVKHQEFELLDLNNIKAEVGLYGLFQDRTNSIASFNVPKQNNPNDPKYTTIYAANLWVAGKNQDSVYMNAETFGTSYNYAPMYSDFKAPSGPIMDSVHYKLEYDYEWDRLWKINIQDIIYHQNNWSSGGYQALEVIENWPAHGDTTKGQAFYLAPFIDYNNDGIYNPYDGDYPKIKGQQAIYFIYNDIRFQANTNRPMKSEVHYMAYAYNCSSDSALNHAVFVDYTIYNRSNLTYDSTYIGSWVDFDIGGSSDDFIGCDVQRSTFYGYNGDAFDEDANGVYGYQNHPPAQGVAFLKGAPQDNDGTDNPLTTNVTQAYAQNGIVYPNLGLGFGDAITDNEYWGMEHFVYYSNGWGQHIGDGDPQNLNDYYNYLRGHWLDNSNFVWGGNGHFSGGGTIPTKYLYPGTSDPFFYGTYGVTPSPAIWSEFTSGNPQGDRRGLGSTGPFTFEPDSSVEITLAFVFGRDYQNTGNTAGIVVMQERVDSIHSYYRNGFITTACGAALSVQKDETNENILQVYPNPFNNQFIINYEPESSRAQLNVFNSFGKLVKALPINQQYSTINLSNEAKGIYFVQIVDGKNVLTKKVVKQ